MKTKSNLWANFKNWVESHKKPAIALSVGLFVLSLAIIGGCAFLLLKPGEVVAMTEQPKIEAPVYPEIFRSPLTGGKVATEELTKRQVTAIMIENSPDARPQSGLRDSGVVFEAIAEGGITRFLALYQEQRPSLIGPVRSVRPYYVDWLASFDAAVAHIGGSANALKEVRNGQYKDIDQFFNAQAYWRATDRYAPHNVYTDFDHLDELNQSKGFTSSSFTAWPRKIDSPPPAPKVTKIDVDVSSPTFDVHYDYDPASNTYLRSFGTGEPHEDREAGRIAPKVVVVMKVPSSIAFEDGYREQMATVGTGQAYFFQDGQIIEGFWNKPNQKAPISFYDKLGQSIVFNEGQIWITVTDPDKDVTWQ
ncbi:MAG TPA: DUF3048 domain-containing protein [Candidatus Saccharimonadales bacterium]|nr:DUF3048 domain-containing protein [Candidatus Saccharimonadales bacterium]